MKLNLFNLSLIFTLVSCNKLIEFNLANKAKGDKVAKGNKAVLSAHMIVSAMQGRKNELVELIDAGVDINFIGNNGYTALMLAAVNGHEDIVEYLIKAGADIAIENEFGFTALDLAKRKNYLTIQLMLNEQMCKSVKNISLESIC